MKPSETKNKPASAAARPKETAPKKLKFSFKEQQEFNDIDSDIAHLEAQLKSLKKEIETAASNYVLLEELLKKESGLETLLHGKMERWLYLNDLADKIAAQKNEGIK